MQMEQHGSARDYGTRFLNASEDNEGLAFRFSVAFKHSLSGVAGSSLSDANREKKIKDVADRLHHLFGGNQQQPTFGHLIIVVQHIGPCRRATRSTSCEVCAKMRLMCPLSISAIADWCNAEYEHRVCIFSQWRTWYTLIICISYHHPSGAACTKQSQTIQNWWCWLISISRRSARWWKRIRALPVVQE